MRIAAGAFGANAPARDLCVSPDHAIYVDTALIPARYLVNGMTICQMPQRRVLYRHIELAEHDVVLAAGLSAEPYLDTGDRAKFSGAQVAARHSDFPVRMWDARR